jgi:hypothetical protein
MTTIEIVWALVLFAWTGLLIGLHHGHRKDRERTAIIERTAGSTWTMTQNLYDIIRQYNPHMPGAGTATRMVRERMPS